jgi:hypothetical protein
MGVRQRYRVSSGFRWRITVRSWHPACTRRAEAILTDAVTMAERDILRYLLAHQDARDTIEGIAQWWLPRSREYGDAGIRAALLRLERRGFIYIWKTVSARELYGLSPGDQRRSLQGYLESLD